MQSCSVAQTLSHLLPSTPTIPRVSPCPSYPLLHQADYLLSLYNGEWGQSVDPIYAPEFTY